MPKSLHDIRYSVMVIGTIQGALLLLAHELIVRKIWPGTSLPFMVAWYTAIIGAPAAVQLLMVKPQDRRPWAYASALSLVLIAVGAYFGATIDPDHARGLYFVFGLTVAVAWFVALPFAAIWIKTGRWRFSYPDLFTYAWNNTLTLAIAGLFTGTFWLLLWLWASLFKVIGIQFFSELFTQRMFIYLVTGVVFGFAVSLGRTYEWAVVTVRNVVLSTLRGLLPLLTGIALLFLLALPFTGLQPLWNTGHAAALMLTLQLLFILFLNATYQDGRDKAPYVSWLRRGVELAAITLPIYSILSLYAIGLRVNQYGWSDDRVWAMLIATISACYATGYAATALARRPRWLPWVGPVNVAMAAVVIAVMILANSPVLDPKRIAVHSQIQRLLSGRVSAEAFDYRYLRFDSGKPGLDGLIRLASLTEHSQAKVIRDKAKSALAVRNRWEEQAAGGPAEVISRIEVLPRGKTLDPGLAAFLFEKKALSNFYCGYRERCLMLAVDLNNDGREEYMFLEYPNSIFSFQDNGWREVGKIASNSKHYRSPRDHKELLNAGKYKIVSSKWPNLQIGEDLYVVVEGDQ